MKQMEMVRAAGRVAICGLICLQLAMGLWTSTVSAQTVSTTTVQGTVYLANGSPGGGTLAIRWPSFTTASGQAIAADSLTVAIPSTGFVSVNLAPNQGSLPAGQYYTAVYYMSDGSTSTEYWVVPAAATATLAQVRATVMPSSQAVQAVSKAYVDQAISTLSQSLITASGGTMVGPLILSSDPTQPLQAADKHYVDTRVATAVPLAGGNMTGGLSSPAVNGVQSPALGSAQTTLQAAVTSAGTSGAVEIPAGYSGTDTFTNPNGVRVNDLRTSGSQQSERSVKEFGAVCDGVTDDTNALQSALNYANAHGVALTIPEGTCKTRTLSWHGESIGGLGKQVSALMGFPGQDVLASAPDSLNILSNTRLHDLTIYVDQSLDASCSAAAGRAAAGTCQVSRLLERNSIFAPGGNGLSGTAGTGAGWAVGNCAIAMPASTGAGGNGLKVAEIENLEIAVTGTDPMAAQYPGAHSTHTCGMYLGQWPQWSEFRNIDIRGVNTAIAIPALPGTIPAGLNADSNRWQNVTVQAVHGFAAGAGSNNVLDNFVAVVGNAAAMAEPPTGLVLDLAGTQQGWTVRNAVVLPSWSALQPALTVTAAGGAVTAVSVGAEHGLGWDPYGTTVPLAFSGSCTAQAGAAVNGDGSIGAVTVTQGGTGCSATTTAKVNAAGTWDTAAPVNLISGTNQSFFAGNLLKGSGGYTVWNATGSKSFGTQLNGGGGNLPGGGSYAGLVGSGPVGSARDVDQFPGADFGAKLQACVNSLSASYGGTCDARNYTGSVAMGSSVTISTSNTTVLLPCATVTTANQIVVTAGTRNVSLRGCALRGGTAASGSAGGTAIAYSGAAAAIQVGDATYAVDTPGFHMDNAVINTTAATAATAEAIAVYRTQELDLESLYLLGNANQTGVTLDGTGNYTGGTFLDDQVSGFQTAVNAIGHQTANAATTDWVNASTFVRLHIDCATSGGNPIVGTYGINLQQGDGNTFTGGDVEGCATALHLGANAVNNTIVGLRNENSISQVVADAGSQYNNWITGGTMFTGKLTDNGTHNSFWDSFHRGFNGLNGDIYRSQTDATITNHWYLGTATGNVRGLQDEYFTDVPSSPGNYQAAWEWGPQDGSAGQQTWALQDMLNNVPRVGVQENSAGGGNPQTYLNAAGGGSVCFNCSANSGTGGVSFASGGATPTTVATIGSTGNAQINGTMQVGGTTQSAGTMTVRNNADAEVDYSLWPGLTTGQKGSFIYKDWNGASQWYLVKDASNNWALNSAVGGLDSFKAYQSTNSGDTYLNASNSTGHVRLNYENGSGAETDIYAGSSSSLVAAFLGPTAIKLPGLAASSGHSCLQIDNSGYITNSGGICGTGTGSVGSGNSGQIAYYTGNGTAIGGESTVPLAAGGTGAATAAGALASLGALAYPGAAGIPYGLTTNTSRAATGSDLTSLLGYTPLNPANNLSDVASLTTALGNLLPGVTRNGSNGITVAGNTQLSGTLGVTGTATFAATPVVQNLANAEIDSILQAGLTASQKESFLYRDYNGNNQWYLVKDANNNWALNSAVGGLDSFKAYQSTNSGDTYIDASNSSGVVRVNYETGSGTGFKVYGGNSSTLYAAFTGATSIAFPGLAASSGHNCLQIDTSGYVTPTGTACGTGSGGGGSGTVGSGTTGQIAYYAANGITISGEDTVPVTAGGTGAASAAAALSNLGGASQTSLSAEITRAESAESSAQATANAALPANGCSTTSGGNLSCPGTVSSGNTLMGSGQDLNVVAFGANNTCASDDTAILNNALNQAWANQQDVFFPAGCYLLSSGALVLPSNPAVNPTDQGRSFRIHGQESGNPFAVPQTTIKQTGNYPIITDLQQASGTANGTVELDHLYLNQVNSSATAAVMVLNTFYGLSRVHDLTIYQGGVGDGLDIGYSATASFDNIYVLNRDSTNYGLGSSRVGIGIYYKATYSSGLVKFRGVTSRGFLTGYQIGSGSGIPYNASIEDSEVSTTYNGIVLNGAYKTKIDNVYFEGAEGGTGVSDGGQYTTVTNTLMFAGYATGIDMSNTSTLGSVASNNLIYLGSMANATGIAVGSNYFGKTAQNNSIYYNAGTNGVCGVAVSGTSPTITITGNVFNPSVPWTGTGTAQICNTALPTNYGLTQYAGAAGTTGSHPYYAQGGVSFYNSGTLTEANVSSGVLTIPAGGTYYTFTPGIATIVTSINAGTEPGRYIVLNVTNANATIANGAYLNLANNANFSGPGMLTLLVDYTTATYSHEISRAYFVSPPAITTTTTTTIPSRLTNLGDGHGGAYSAPASSNVSLSGIYNWTSLTVPAGSSITVNAGSGFVAHVNGTCTINGNIYARGSDTGGSYGSCGGSGGGAAAGTAGTGSWTSAFGVGSQLVTGGTAGASSGGSGANGGSPSSASNMACDESGGGFGGLGMGGGPGAQGGSGGGAKGIGGAAVTLICNQIVGTGAIDVSGQYGSPASANSTGAGSGGGGGVVQLVSVQSVSNWPQVYMEGGAGGLCAAPMAVWQSDTCSSPAKVTLAVSGGSLAGGSVVQAGAGCGGFGNFKILGGGGSGGTITPTWQTGSATGTWASGSYTINLSSQSGTIVVGMGVSGVGIPANDFITGINGPTVTLLNPPASSGAGVGLTFTGGALQSVTASGGSGYTAATYTTCGTGGDGAPGYYALYSNGVQIH